MLPQGATMATYAAAEKEKKPFWKKPIEKRSQNKPAGFAAPKKEKLQKIYTQKLKKEGSKIKALESLAREVAQEPENKLENAQRTIEALEEVHKISTEKGTQAYEEVKELYGPGIPMKDVQELYKPGEGQIEINKTKK